MNIFGVDPGKVTGLSIHRPQFKHFVDECPATVAVQLTWDLLEDISDVGDQAVVVCERYDVTADTLRKTREYDALYVTGSLLYKCDQLGFQFVQYGRADAKNFSTDKKVKAMGMWLTGGAGHGNDGSRQVILYMAKNNLLPALNLT